MLLRFSVEQQHAAAHHIVTTINRKAVIFMIANTRSMTMPKHVKTNIVVTMESRASSGVNIENRTTKPIKTK